MKVKEDFMFHQLPSSRPELPADPELVAATIQHRKPWASLQGIMTGFLSRAKSPRSEKNTQAPDYHKLLEAERQRTLSAAKMATLGEMAAGIAHEINNPVALIQLLSNELNRLCQGAAVDITLAQQLSLRIEKQATYLARVMQSVNSFSRDGTRDPLELTQLHKLVHGALDLCREKLRMKNVTLIVDEIPLDVFLNCRPIAVTQVILNLVQNSLDAVENRNERWIRIGFSTENSGPRLLVTDAGPGVPAELREKIFQPFFTTKQAGKGTGLGLSLSRAIIEEHGGRLEFCPKQQGFQMLFGEINYV